MLLSGIRTDLSLPADVPATQWLYWKSWRVIAHQHNGVTIRLNSKIADDPRMLRASAAVAYKINRVQSIKGFAVNVNTGSPNSLRSRVLVRALINMCLDQWLPFFCGALHCGCKVLSKVIV